MNLRNRSIGKYEVEALCRDVLNQSQIKQISNLLKLLGIYVFVDRNQLDNLAVRHFGSKIGLSYIQKAVDYNLIAELQGNDVDKFYFQLKQGGFLFLDDIEFHYRKLPLDAASWERSKILSINQYLIDHGHLLTNEHGLGVFEPLFTRKSVVIFNEMLEESLRAAVDKRVWRQEFRI